MDAAFIAAVLWKRRTLRGRQHWAESKVDAWRTDAARRLREYAFAKSPFYQRLHRGLTGAPLSELPVVTKAQLMAEYDEAVTDRRLRLSALRQHLESDRATALLLNEYRVVRTAGSTGKPGVFISSRGEWSTIVASYSRAQEWAGIRASPLRRTRLAVVSSRVPWHQSAQVGMSVDSPFIPVRRFDATQPLSEIVSDLNEWQPDNLIAYASMAHLLAEEQLEGRLQISPKAVMCASEVLTDEAKQRVRRAFGRAPFNVYAATETAGIASDCIRHRMHLYEDLVIPEVVDEANRPVPLGQVGAKLLVTVLFSRTLPLIRYEMSDRVALSGERCDCGLGFHLLGAVDGRAEDVLAFRTNGSPIRVHPNVFHRVLEAVDVAEWQVQQTADGVHVLLARPGPHVDAVKVREEVRRELQGIGLDGAAVTVQKVDRVARTPLGKAPLIQARK